jgi:hypothetical protein
MSGVVTAIGAGAVTNLIISNQQSKAAEGAANAQQQSIDAATDVERERLQMEAQQYQEQMAEYRRKQAMLEKQQAQTITNLAPYIQGGQGALYEMLALNGIAAPAGATSTATTTSPLLTAPAAASVPTQTAGRGILSNSLFPGIASATPTATGAGITSPAAAEFSKGGRSLSSSAWQNISADASPRAAAAQMLAQVKSEMPGASEADQQAEAIARLNAQYSGLQQQQGLQAAADTVPTIAPAENQYAGMTGEQAQAAAIERVAQSPLLQELMAQGETGILQNVAATGGLRGGNVQGVLSQYRPQMLQTEIDKLYSRLSGISGLGQQSTLASPTTTVGSVPTYSADTSTLSNLYTQAGASQAGNILSQAQNQANLFSNLGQIAGWGIEKYAGGNTGTGFGFGGSTPSSIGNYALNW